MLGKINTAAPNGCSTDDQNRSRITPDPDSFIGGGSETRERFIKAIRSGLTEQEKDFLLSFKARNPRWELLGLNGIDQLPAVKWKMLNLQKMPKEKHDKALKALEVALASEG